MYGEIGRDKSLKSGRFIGKSHFDWPCPLPPRPVFNPDGETTERKLAQN